MTKKNSAYFFSFVNGFKIFLGIYNKYEHIFEKYKLWFIYTISVTVPTTIEALKERLRGVHEIISLLHNRMIDNIKYRQKRLNYIVEKDAKEE